MSNENSADTQPVDVPQESGIPVDVSVDDELIERPVTGVGSEVVDEPDPALEADSSTDVVADSEAASEVSVEDIVDPDASNIPVDDFSDLLLHSPNVTATEQCTSPRPDRLATTNDFIFTPSVSPAEMKRRGDQMTDEQGEAVAKSPNGAEWLQATMESASLMLPADTLANCQNRPGSDWQQRPVLEGERLGIARPRFGSDKEAGRLSGVRAAIRMQQVIGAGALLRFPLWHSGIWITIKAPSDGEILELERRVSLEKVIVGLQSKGMVFSNSQVVLIDYVTEMILNNVYAATVEYDDPLELRQKIDTDDLPTLIWGALCTMYPNGYPHSRPCVAGPAKCTHVVSEILELAKLSWTDTSRLTAYQRTHMSKRSGKRTAEEMERYRSQFSRAKREVKLNNMVTVLLRSPTLQEYIEGGQAWINSLTAGVDEAFSGMMSAEERNNTILQAAALSGANQYRHYVERIVIRNENSDGDNFIDSPEDIGASLDAISGDRALFEKFLSAVGDYIEDTTFSMIAIPRYNCPACDQDQALYVRRELDPADMKVHPYLIPLDTVGLFFTITGRRISRARLRTKPASTK